MNSRANGSINTYKEILLDDESAIAFDAFCKILQYLKLLLDYEFATTFAAFCKILQHIKQID